MCKRLEMVSRRRRHSKDALTESWDEMSYRVDVDAVDTVVDSETTTTGSSCVVRGLFDAFPSSPVESTRFLTRSFFSSTGVALVSAVAISRPLPLYSLGSLSGMIFCCFPPRY